MFNLHAFINEKTMKLDRRNCMTELTCMSLKKM